MIDCTNDCVYLVGPGGYEIKLSPGSNKYALEPSEGGRWMLPFAEFPTHISRDNGDGDVETFVQGECFNVDHVTDHAVDKCADPSVADPVRIPTRKMEEDLDAARAARAAVAATE